MRGTLTQKPGRFGPLWKYTLDSFSYAFAEKLTESAVRACIQVMEQHRLFGGRASFTHASPQFERLGWRRAQGGTILERCPVKKPKQKKLPALWGIYKGNNGTYYANKHWGYPGDEPVRLVGGPAKARRLAIELEGKEGYESIASESR